LIWAIRTACATISGHACLVMPIAPHGDVLDAEIRRVIDDPDAGVGNPSRLLHRDAVGCREKTMSHALSASSDGAVKSRST
jgi:hypothetical protein